MESSGTAVGGLYDTRRLASRLGVEPTSIRAWLARGKRNPETAIIPEPVGALHGNVWTEEQVRQIEANIPHRRKAGRPRKDQS